MGESYCGGEEYRDDIQSLHEEGLQASKEGDHQRCADLFRDAVKLAEADGNRAVTDHLRWHWGAALMELGRIASCVGILTPILNDQPYQLGETDYLGTGEGELLMFRIGACLYYVHAAVLSGSPAKAVDRCIDMMLADACAFENGEYQQEIDLICLMAGVNLLLSRGRYDEAAAVSQKAMAKVRGEHADEVICACARSYAEMGDVKKAKQYMARSRRLGREERMTGMLANIVIARREGKSETAVDLANSAYFRTFGHVRFDLRFLPVIQKIEAELSAGYTDEARRTLLTFRMEHYREAKLHRIELARLFGEYHLIMALRQTGAAIADCRYGEQMLPHIVMHRNNRKIPVARRHLHRALVSLRRAAKMAEPFDRKAWTKHGELIDRRMAVARRLLERLSAVE